MEERLPAATGNIREGMIALDTHGVEVAMKIGEPDQIGFTRAEIEAMVGQVDLVTHNHDDDSAFTVDDMNFAVVVDVREINAFGPTHRCA